MKNSNIILIVLDTARAKTVWSMMDRDELPGLEKFATIGTTYRQAFTTSPWTLPSHASLFTGQRSSDHGTHAGTKRFDPSVPSLPELLSEKGYRTVGISGNSWISGEFGFDRGFDNLSMKWDYFWQGRDLSTISNTSGIERLQKILNIVFDHQAPHSIGNALYAKILSNKYDDGAKLTTDRTIKWIRSNNEEPFFYFINYLEPHLPYKPPKEFKNNYDFEKEPEQVNQNPWEYIAGKETMTELDFEILTQLYQAELSYLDSQIDRLYDCLNHSNLLDSTAVFIVGDHGEHIGDHELMDHQYSLHDSLLHVPLIAHYPGQNTSKENNNLVEIRDIYSTSLSLANINIPSYDGISDFDLLDNSSRDAVFGEYRYPQPDMNSLEQSVSDLRDNYRELDQTLRSIRTDNWKLIETEQGETLLYKSTDEFTELSSNYPEIVSKLRDEMEQEGILLNRDEKKDIEISNKNKERLEDLGYI
ncbi:sulfatase [Halalkalicoccus paucihalophilus]|uniref:Sulfatase n=1 Tax=Halalkalicoccus paucihalophilus TaxID=1008153 RepID=A0A151AB22_9EURY|nr:sulfatase [Halalkalicoccus paucihalophilus]KYH24898.1 sulfatase [Halalkalicoccus paucihalophilus]